MRAAGTKANQIGVADTAISTEHREINLIVEVKGNTVIVFPTNFPITLLDQMWHPYRTSVLGPHDIKTTFKLVRNNGDLERADTVSGAICKRMKAQKMRMRS